MNEEQMQDLRDFLTTTIRNEVHGAVDENVREIVREEIAEFRTAVNARFEQVDRQFVELRSDMNQQFEQVDRRFEQVDRQLVELRSDMHDGFHEVDVKLDALQQAVGERFDDHEQRIQVLEKKPGNGSLRLRRAA